MAGNLNVENRILFALLVLSRLRIQTKLDMNITRGITHLKLIIHEVGSDWKKSDKMAGNLNAKLCLLKVSVGLNLRYLHKY